MSLLHPTTADRLVDAAGRPYFLWDMDMTLDEFRRQLQSPDRPTRAYFVGKLMRQGKPDDLFTFVPLATVCELWSDVQPYLGKTRAFWHWLMEAWRLP